MARVRPPSVIRLIDCPAAQSATVAESNASGIVTATSKALRMLPRASRMIRPVNNAPNAPSVVSALIAFST